MGVKDIPLNKQMEKLTQKTTDAWQILRIQGEFTKIFDELSDIIPSISILGSARTKEGSKWYEEAYKAGKYLAKFGFGVITGGGPGIMEAANRGADEAGLVQAHSFGVGIELPFEKGMNEAVQAGVTCRYFFTRKVAFLKYSQGFIFFPGGLGTLDELFETLTLSQTGHAPKFPIILVGSEYWGGLIEWIKTSLLESGYIKEDDMEMFRIVDTAKEAVLKILEFNNKYRPNQTTNF